MRSMITFPTPGGSSLSSISRVSPHVSPGNVSSVSPGAGSYQGPRDKSKVVSHVSPYSGVPSDTLSVVCRSGGANVSSVSVDNVTTVGQRAEEVFRRWMNDFFSILISVAIFSRFFSYSYPISTVIL